MYLVTLGPPEPDTGSPKNHVLAMSSLNGELVKDAPATIEVSAAKPRSGGLPEEAPALEGSRGETAERGVAAAREVARRTRSESATRS